MTNNRILAKLSHVSGRACATTAIGLLLTIATVAVAGAAEIKVFSTIGLRAVLLELGPQFENTTRHKLTLTFDVAAALKRRIDSGEAFDVAILTVPIMDELIKQGQIVADTRVDVARGGMGLAVRAGTPKSDVSSAESFKQTLLGAKSITYPKEGLAGISFTRVQERLGIAEAIKPKARLTGSESPAELVARGEAEMAAHIIPELVAVKGSSSSGHSRPTSRSTSCFLAALAPMPPSRRPRGNCCNFWSGPPRARS